MCIRDRNEAQAKPPRNPEETDAIQMDANAIEQVLAEQEQHRPKPVHFVEGDDIYKGNVDVIVCDGFEGNIALKASEGVAKMFSFFIKKSFTKNIFTKLVAIIARPVMKDFRSKVDPGKYNGASLLGLKGVVVKSHGNADIDSFFQAIREAYLEAHAKITDKISEQLTRELEEHK